MVVRYTKTAQKQLARIAPKFAALIIAKIKQYAANPSSLANQVKKLTGRPSLRLRVGDYRVIFTENGVVMDIVEVGHCRDIYD